MCVTQFGGMGLSGEEEKEEVAGGGMGKDF